MPGQERSARFFVEIEGHGVGVPVAQRTGYNYFVADQSTARIGGGNSASPSQAQTAGSAPCENAVSLMRALSD